MKLKFLAALALSAVLLLSGCAAPAKNETTPLSLRCNVSVVLLFLFMLSV